MNKWSAPALIAATLFFVGSLLSQTQPDKASPEINALIDPSAGMGNFVKSFEQYQKLYRSVRTLEYTAVRRATDSKHDPALLPESIHFIAEGEKYWYDYDAVRLPGQSDFCFIASYDGEYTRKFSKSSGGLTNQKGIGTDGGTLFGHNYFFLPQEFIAFPYRPNAGLIVKPDTLSNPKVWGEFLARAKLAGRALLGGRDCLSFEMDIGQEFATGLPAKMRLFLDPGSNDYPVGWDILTTSGKLLTSYRVTKLGTCKVPGTSFALPYPKKATRMSFVKDNKAVTEMSSSSEISVLDVRVNQEIDEDRLQIAPATATGIYDVDAKAFIEVPK